MAKFLNELNARLIDDDKIWMLLSPLDYASDIVNTIVSVPTGFNTDFASIPRWLPIVSNILLGKAHREGVIHDYLYRKDSEPVVTRKQADDIIYEAMIVRGKGKVIAFAVWSGVRIGGYFSYHKRSVKDKLC